MRLDDLDQLVDSPCRHSAMLWPLILQLSAAWLSRAPLHSEHGADGHIGRHCLLRALRHGFDVALDVLGRELLDDALERSG